jgi:hypothetical protein
VIPFLGDSPLSTILAGTIGVLVVAAVAIVLTLLLRRSRRSGA